MQTVVETPTFLRAAADLLTEHEQVRLVATIASNPEAGDVMQGTGGFRKLRFGRAGIGKRGGVRVIYLYGGTDLPIILLTLYAKSDKGNLSQAERNKMVAMATSFFNHYRRKG